MGVFEVQGIVATNGLPFVQCRQIDDEGNLEAKFQFTPQEAREVAQRILEAAMNATYDGAIVAWCQEVAPENAAMGPQLLTLIRKYRSDIWGLPDQPTDWRTDGA